MLLPAQVTFTNTAPKSCQELLSADEMLEQSPGGAREQPTCYLKLRGISQSPGLPVCDVASISTPGQEGP